MTKRKRRYCAGCDNDFYNGNNEFHIEECWHLGDAKVVTRYRIGAWTVPRSASCFTRVRTFNCYRAPGCAHFTELPSHLRGQEKDVLKETTS